MSYIKNFFLKKITKKPFDNHEIFQYHVYHLSLWKKMMRQGLKLISLNFLLSLKELLKKKEFRSPYESLIIATQHSLPMLKFIPYLGIYNRGGVTVPVANTIKFSMLMKELFALTRNSRGKVVIEHMAKALLSFVYETGPIIEETRSTYVSVEQFVDELKRKRYLKRRRIIFYKKK